MSAKRAGRQGAAVSLVQGGASGQADPEPSTDRDAVEPRRRRPGIHPNTVVALKVFMAILVLGLPLTYIASLDTPGLYDLAPEPPRETQREPAGLGMADFDAERASVIARMEALVQQERYREALGVAKDHPDLGLVEAVRELRVLARRELDRQREAEILEELKRIPVSEFKLNLDRYAELVELNPDEAEYRQKLQFYEQKYREQGAN